MDFFNSAVDVLQTDPLYIRRSSDNNTFIKDSTCHK